MSESSVVEDSVEAELAYLYEEISLLDQAIRQLELFARLSCQLTAGSGKGGTRKAARAAQAGA